MRFNAMALIGMSEASGALDDEARRRLVATIADQSVELIRLNTGEAGFTFELGTNVVLGRA